MTADGNVETHKALNLLKNFGYESSLKHHIYLVRDLTVPDHQPSHEDESKSKQITKV